MTKEEAAVEAVRRCGENAIVEVAGDRCRVGLRRGDKFYWLAEGDSWESVIDKAAPPKEGWGRKTSP
jgi:hypothetical protein